MLVNFHNEAIKSAFDHFLEEFTKSKVLCILHCIVLHAALSSESVALQGLCVKNCQKTRGSKSKLRGSPSWPWLVRMKALAIWSAFKTSRLRRY